MPTEQNSRSPTNIPAVDGADVEGTQVATGERHTMPTRTLRHTVAPGPDSFHPSASAVMGQEITPRPDAPGTQLGDASGMTKPDHSTEVEVRGRGSEGARSGEPAATQDRNSVSTSLPEGTRQWADRVRAADDDEALNLLIQRGLADVTNPATLRELTDAGLRERLYSNRGWFDGSGIAGKLGSGGVSGVGGPAWLRRQKRQPPQPWVSRLHPVSRRLWNDRQDRKAWIERIRSAYQAWHAVDAQLKGLDDSVNSDELAKYRLREQQALADLNYRVDFMDNAIVDSLLQLKLPRGLTNSRRIEDMRHRGEKEPTCNLLLSYQLILDVLDVSQNTDTLVHVWIHESIRARDAFTPDYLLEYERHMGYEDGLAEVLARWVTVEKGGLAPDLSAYNYYVQGYAVLAKALGTTPDVLCKELFLFQPGEVRKRLPEAIDQIRQKTKLKHLTRAQCARIRSVMDAIFDRDLSDEMPSLFSYAYMYARCLWALR